MSSTVLFFLREINRFLETLSSFCIFEKALFLDPRNSILETRDSILETRSSNVSSIEARGSSLEVRVSSVNLLLSGTVIALSGYVEENPGPFTQINNNKNAPCTKQVNSVSLLESRLSECGRI